MTSFIDLPVELDPAQRIQDAFDALALRFPGWVASEGNLDVAILEETALMAHETAVVASQAAEGIFRYFGASLLGLAPQDGATASGLVTISAIDAAGYTLPAGTEIGYRASGDEIYSFVLEADALIAVGQTQVTGVPITASDVGVSRNGIAANTVLVVMDAYAWVESIVLTTDTSGGLDAESDAAYLDRLHDALQLLAPRPILPGDYAALAREVEGVYRATAIDGLDPQDGSTGNERTITVVALDAAGNKVSLAVQDELTAYLQSRREVNFQIFVWDAYYDPVAISYSVQATLDADPFEVQAAVTAALRQALSPAVWGGGDLTPPVWVNTKVIRRFDLVGVIMRVSGVAHVDALTINGVAGDFTMRSDAVAPLPDFNPTITGGVT